MIRDYDPSKGGVLDSTLPFDPARCASQVVTYQGLWSCAHQCSRKVKGGARYCKQHNPDAVKEREQARLAKFDAGMHKTRFQLSARKFALALAKIRDGDNNPRATAAAALEGFDI